MSRFISENQRVTAAWIAHEIKWPLEEPLTISQLHHLESVYNVFELYCWLR